MKTLILMRHSEAAGARPGQSDFDRPLTESGRHLVHQTAPLLLQRITRLDRIIASSAVRTRQTAEELVSAAFPDTPLLTRPELYEAPRASYLAVLRSAAEPEDEAVLLVGHNPVVAHLICHLAEQSFSVSPCTVAVFELDLADWCDFRFESRADCRLTALFQEGREAKLH